MTEQELREKIIGILKNRKVDTLFNEHVASVYGKEDAPNCENYLIITANLILAAIKENYVSKEEIEKLEVIGDEQIGELIYVKDTEKLLPGIWLEFLEMLRGIAQAQLQDVKDTLLGVKK